MMRHGQSRRMSLVEQLCNVASGIVTAVVVGQIIYPMFGYSVTVADNLGLTAIFTAVSVVRGYVWRRVFNWWHCRESAYGG